MSSPWPGEEYSIYCPITLEKKFSLSSSKADTVPISKAKALPRALLVVSGLRKCVKINSAP